MVCRFTDLLGKYFLFAMHIGLFWEGFSFLAFIRPSVFLLSAFVHLVLLSFVKSVIRQFVSLECFFVRGFLFAWV
jgi:hypothetical protein